MEYLLRELPSTYCPGFAGSVRFENGGWGPSTYRRTSPWEHLEQEADRLVAELLEAERRATAIVADLLPRLNALAEPHREAMDTWEADMRCGDLPPDDGATAQAEEIYTRARNAMYSEILSAGNPPEWGSE